MTDKPNLAEVVFHKHTYPKTPKTELSGKDVILLDENNTFYNIRLLIKEKYPNIPIEIINEGRGER